MIHNVCILGFGAWGAATAIHLSKHSRRSIHAWEALKDLRNSIHETGQHPNLGESSQIPSHVTVIDKPGDLPVTKNTLLLVAVASPFIKNALRRLNHDFLAKTGHRPKPWACVALSKGIDPDTLKLPTQTVCDELDITTDSVFALTGPTIAKELVEGAVTVATLAGPAGAKRREIRALFDKGNFIVTQSNDAIVAQIGGSMKNIYAIGYGILDALRAPANAKAYYLVSAMREIETMASRFSGNPAASLYGEAGLGDLLTTSLSLNSRNSRLGRQLAQGKRLKDIQKEIGMVTEGVDACLSYLKLSRKYGVSLPLAKTIEKIMISPSKASQLLLCLGRVNIHDKS